MSADPEFVPPARFTKDCSFWQLQSDGRTVWIGADGTARDAIGLVVPLIEVLRDGIRATERDFRMALFSQGRSCPLRLPSGELVGGRKLKLARYGIPPVPARGDPPWISRGVRMFAVLDLRGAQVAELCFHWKGDSWHFGHSAFMNNFEIRIGYDDCGRLSLAAEERDWATVDAFHPEALPWYCRVCQCNYPEERWHERMCPHGHQRMISPRP